MYKLLIAEEDAHIRRQLERADWAGAGFEPPVFAGTMAEGVSRALQHRPQVILVSRTLGQRPGWELPGRLRSADSGYSPICCLLGSHMDFQELRTAMRWGCRDVLKRPPGAGELAEFLSWVTATLREGDGAAGFDPVLHREYAAFGKVTGRVLLAVRIGCRAPISLLSIAREMDMSSKYIGRIFLRETGMRFTEYLMAYRMQEARRLILNTEEKISVIAGMVGYSQQNNFYTHFRRYYGISPGMLRSGNPTEEENP